MRLFFENYVPFVVIVRRGCKGFGGSKFIICDLESKLLWYMCKGEGFGSNWFKSARKSKYPILELNKEVLWVKVWVFDFLIGEFLKIEVDFLSIGIAFSRFWRLFLISVQFLRSRIFASFYLFRNKPPLLSKIKITHTPL